MESRIVETEELAQMLLDDMARKEDRWNYEKIYTMMGFNGSYPQPNTLAHFKWNQFRGKKRIAVNKYFEIKRRPERIIVAHGSNWLGKATRNEWRAVPKEEALAWCALESATKITGPMLLAAGRALGLSNAEGLPMDVAMNFRALAAGIEAISSSVLKNCQSINGLPEATIKDLQEWYNRKARKYRKLLKE